MSVVKSVYSYLSSSLKKWTPPSEALTWFWERLSAVLRQGRPLGFSLKRVTVRSASALQDE